MGLRVRSACLANRHGSAVTLLNLIRVMPA